VSIVAAFTDHQLDKYSLLEKVLESARFFEILEQAWSNSGKEKKDFKIALKASISMMLRRNDVGIYTDPFLVIHLLRLILKRGYQNLAVVESRNLYGNWFQNRAVIQIAARAGYFEESIIKSGEEEKSRNILVKGDGVNARVPLIDLSLDTVLHNFGDPVGQILVGKTWTEADFRINLAKMKTHFYSCYTLAIKNIYGCLPIQDKVRAYHCQRKVGPWTAQLIKSFPVHFSIVDGYSSADGWLGVKIKAIAVKSHTIIAGADILAVDHYGAGILRVKPERSVLYTSLAKLVPFKNYQVAGNAVSPKPWRNSPYFFTLFCRLIEANSNIMDFSGALATGGYDPCFPHARTNRGILKKFLYYLTVPANFLSDLGVARLRIREGRFQRTFKKQAEKIPLLAGSDFILSRLTLLSAKDLEILTEILDQGLGPEITFSGHYLFLKNREIPFPSRLTTANLAAVEILKEIQARKLDSRAFSDELRKLPKLFPSFYAPDNPYPYCYR